MAYYDELIVGTKRRFGSYEMKREEMVEWASKFDPQPFHLDDEAAANSPFGKLSASGQLTMAIVTREMLFEAMAHQGEAAGGIGLGIDRLRWPRPVFVGDVLSFEQETVAVEPSKSRPGYGKVTTRICAYNQDDQPVFSMESLSLMKGRPQG